MATHDLKTPLANIEGLYGMLTENLGPLSEENTDFLDRIGEEILKFRITLNDLQRTTDMSEEEDTETLSLLLFCSDAAAAVRSTLNKINGTQYLYLRRSYYKVKAFIFNGYFFQPIYKFDCLPRQ